MICGLVTLLSISCFGLNYPPLRLDPQTDNYHGTLVADPYRYLEDSYSPESKEWIAAENALTASYLQQIPEREAIRQKLETLWNYEKYVSLIKKGGRYFLTMSKGLQNQPVIYTLRHLDESPEMLLDPNALALDGTISVQMRTPSHDGEWFAYALSDSGSDWTEIRIRNVNTKEDLEERLLWVKFPEVAWLGDGTGFYYCRFDEPIEETKYSAAGGKHKLYFHTLGTMQASDRLICESPEDGIWYLSPKIDAEENYLIISLFKGFGLHNAVFYQKLGEEGASILPLFPECDASYIYIGNLGSQFWFLTELDAPLKKLIAVDLEERAIRDLIPEGKEPIEEVALIAGKFVVLSLKDASSRLYVHRLDGSFEREIPLPSLGMAEMFLQNDSEEELFFSFSSFTQPRSIYGTFFSTGDTRPLFQPSLSFAPEEYETEQFFYDSKDGTKIPLFLSYKKGALLDGPQPAYLYGYGGFNVSIEPFFSPANLAWMEMGGLFAVANLRGGGEYGKSWHEAGMLEKKQNVFDDFISAAEWLISQNRSSPSQLAIGGASNGGLLVGACLNQRPDLFAAALPMVGVHDMLRYQQFTLGRGWVSEYGSSEDPDQFSYLYRYSPLHNIRNQAYPPTLILTGDHDDRVVPAHSYKYAASLQNAQRASHPILLRVNPSAGHGLGTPIAKQIDEAVDKLAFIVSFTKKK